MTSFEESKEKWEGGGGDRRGGNDGGGAGLLGQEAADEVRTRAAFVRELVQAAGRWAGHVRPVFALPGGLAQLQARVMELLPGEPRSRVELGFCKRTAVRPGGLVAGLWIEPVRSGASIYELGVAGPLVTGSQRSFAALSTFSSTLNWS